MSNLVEIWERFSQLKEKDKWLIFLDHFVDIPNTKKVPHILYINIL